MVSDCGSLATITVKPSDRYRPRAKFFRSTLRLIRSMPASAASVAMARSSSRPRPLPRQAAATPIPSSGTSGPTKP
jgi:hypothetical protein